MGVAENAVGGALDARAPHQPRCVLEERECECGWVGVRVCVCEIECLCVCV